MKTALDLLRELRRQRDLVSPKAFDKIDGIDKTSASAPPAARTIAGRTGLATIVQTENQCGQCLAWKLSALVELGRGQRIFLCPGCLQKHRRGTGRIA
jgi:hypothetical protein